MPAAYGQDSAQKVGRGQDICGRQRRPSFCLEAVSPGPLAQSCHPRPSAAGQGRIYHRPLRPRPVGRPAPPRHHSRLRGDGLRPSRLAGRDTAERRRETISRCGAAHGILHQAVPRPPHTPPRHQAREFPLHRPGAHDICPHRLRHRPLDQRRRPGEGRHGQVELLRVARRLDELQRPHHICRPPHRLLLDGHDPAGPVAGSRPLLQTLSLRPAGGARPPQAQQQGDTRDTRRARRHERPLALAARAPARGRRPEPRGI